MEAGMLGDTVAEEILGYLSDTEHHLNETLTPYREFSVRDTVYYFTPGGFLYRKDPGAEEVGGFCGFLTDEVWHYRTDDG